MKKTSCVTLSLLACFSASAVAGPPVPTSTPSGWRLSAGPMLRQVGGPDFTVGAGAANITLPAVFGVEVPIVAPTAAGAVGAFANRTYDDGFVNTDAGTAGTGLTAAWGYDANTQYSGGLGGILTMRIAPGSALAGSAHLLSSSTSSTELSVNGSDEYEAGLHAELDRLIKRSKERRSGLVFGISLFQGEGNSGANGAFTGTMQADDYSVGVTDRFQVGAGVLPPGAPYSNPGGGIGPLIPNLPDSRSIDTALTGSSTASFTSLSTVDFDYTAITLDAGYKSEWQKGNYQLSLSGGAALNILDWQGSHRETASQTIMGVTSNYATVNESNSGTDVLLGLYVQAGAGVAITPTTTLNSYFRYDLTQELDEKIGPSKVEQDLSGWSFGIGITQEF